MTDNRTTEKPSCDECGIKKIFTMSQERRVEASKLARETFRAARESRVDIGELIKCIANEYAASEASYAEREASRGSYHEGFDEGYSAGYKDGRFR